MKKVADKLSILKMTPEERNGYYAYMKQIYTDLDSLETATEKGRAQGREEERQKHEEERKKYEEERQKHEEEKKTIVRKMLAKGISIKEVGELMDLSEQEIKSLEPQG
jgi:predicted transposase/invertase (TIGR01784 family)